MEGQNGGVEAENGALDCLYRIQLVPESQHFNGEHDSDPDPR